ncbi:hypothetical protein T11_2830 [Trichinella zimbabwensis]|uniref:Uncharacterized protein n=1 Tax=Trichinella zimbabwensis TaxID=268475 RepID=A0A0V1HWN1_9BILA|nr:hypothetical protein T11_2830 [Trichinella zimbabwensis]
MIGIQILIRIIMMSNPLSSFQQGSNSQIHQGYHSRLLKNEHSLRHYENPNLVALSSATKQLSFNIRSMCIPALSRISNFGNNRALLNLTQFSQNVHAKFEKKLNDKSECNAVSNLKEVFSGGCLMRERQLLAHAIVTNIRIQLLCTLFNLPVHLYHCDW